MYGSNALAVEVPVHPGGPFSVRVAFDSVDVCHRNLQILPKIQPSGTAMETQKVEGGEHGNIDRLASSLRPWKKERVSRWKMKIKWVLHASSNTGVGMTVKKITATPKNDHLTGKHREPHSKSNYCTPVLRLNERKVSSCSTGIIQASSF